MDEKESDEDVDAADDGGEEEEEAAEVAASDVSGVHDGCAALYTEFAINATITRLLPRPIASASMEPQAARGCSPAIPVLVNRLYQY